MMRVFVLGQCIMASLAYPQLASKESTNVAIDASGDTRLLRQERRRRKDGGNPDFVGCPSPAGSLEGTDGCHVPELSCFSGEPIKLDLDGYSGSDLSGVTYNKDSDTIVVVDNGEKRAYEYELDIGGEKGVEKGRWELTGWADPEGIAWITGSRYAIADEHPAPDAPDGEVYEACLVRDQKSVQKGELILKAPWDRRRRAGPTDNVGFEGVTRLGDGSYLAAKEMVPAIFGSANGGTDLSHDLKELSGSEIKDVAGLSRRCASTTEFYMQSQEEGKIYRMKVDGMEVLEEKDISQIHQPEGMTFAWKEGNVQLIVVGEPNEMWVWESKCPIPTNSFAL